MTELEEKVFKFGFKEYTKEDLEMELNELDFLRDAFLILLNEEVTSKSDLPYTKDQVIKRAKQNYMESGYSNEFIEECFRGK